MSWSSKKQYIIALSSTEAEYITLTHVVKEALWLRVFLTEVQGSSYGAVSINCDNQSDIALSKDNKFHARTKHIDPRYHFIRECVADGRIIVNYIPTNENVSDIFTKALPKPKYNELVRALGLGPRV